MKSNKYMPKCGKQRQFRFSPLISGRFKDYLSFLFSLDWIGAFLWPHQLWRSLFLMRQSHALAIALGFGVDF